MRKFLFLLAWVEGSDSACGEKTLVHKQADLLKQFKNGNNHVFAFGIKVPNTITAMTAITIAANTGYAAAFHDNYTGHDTVSVCMPLNDTGMEDFPPNIAVMEYSY